MKLALVALAVLALSASVAVATCPSTPVCRCRPPATSVSITNDAGCPDCVCVAPDTESTASSTAASSSTSSTTTTTRSTTTATTTTTTRATTTTRTTTFTTATTTTATISFTTRSTTKTTTATVASCNFRPCNCRSDSQRVTFFNEQGCPDCFCERITTPSQETTTSAASSGAPTATTSTSPESRSSTLTHPTVQVTSEACSQCLSLTAAQVDDLWASMEQAMASQDVAAVMARLSHWPQIFTYDVAESLDTLDAISAYLRAALANNMRINFRSSFSTSSGCNMAIKAGQGAVTLTDAQTGEQHWVAVSISVLFKFESGSWRIRNLHMGLIPGDTATTASAQTSTRSTTTRPPTTTTRSTSTSSTTTTTRETTTTRTTTTTSSTTTTRTTTTTRATTTATTTATTVCGTPRVCRCRPGSVSLAYINDAGCEDCLCTLQ